MGFEIHKGDDRRLMSHFSSANTFGYEPAGIKLLNRVFDKVVEAVLARAGGEHALTGLDIQARDEKVARAILDVCYDDSGNIDVPDLAAQVLVRLGFK